MSPRVSVIVPSYNHAPFLRQCLTTALNQHGIDLEVIVVDDCSTDDSVAVARSMKDPRIRVLVNDDNIGTYATQNRGMRVATGEFIAILNSDDEWGPNKISGQLELLDRFPNSSLCYTLGSQVDEKSDELDIDQHGSWPRTETQDLLPFLLSSNRLLASSVMFRRGDVWFDESLRYSGDWIAWLQLAARTEALCVPDNLTCWRQHAANSYTRTKRVTLEEIRVRRSILAAKDHWLEIGTRPVSPPVELGSWAKEHPHTSPLLTPASHPTTQQLSPPSPVTRHASISRALSDCAVDLAALYVLVGEMRLARAAAREAIRLDQTSQSARRRRILSILPAALARHRLWKSDELPIERSELDTQPLLDLT